MAYTGTGVVSTGFPMDAFTFTYLLSGLARTGAYAADDLTVFAAQGKAVSWDNTAASTVKLAADGDTIVGRVRSSENRGTLGFYTAAVARKFKEKLPAAPGHGIVVGDTVVGAGNGLVKKNTGVASNTVVREVFTDAVAVEHL